MGVGNGEEILKLSSTRKPPGVLLKSSQQFHSEERKKKIKFGLREEVWKTEQKETEVQSKV